MISPITRFRQRISDSGFETQRYLIKWLILSSLIGIVAGVSAIAFTSAIEFVTHLSLGRWVGEGPTAQMSAGFGSILEC